MNELDGDTIRQLLAEVAAEIEPTASHTIIVVDGSLLAWQGDALALQHLWR